MSFCWVPVRVSERAIEDSVLLLLIVVGSNVFCEGMRCLARWIFIRVRLVCCPRLVAVVHNVATVSAAIDLCVQLVDFVTITQIVSPLVVVEVLGWARIPFVPLKVHERCRSPCSVVVPRVNSCDEVTSSL